VTHVEDDEGGDVGREWDLLLWGCLGGLAEMLYPCCCCSIFFSNWARKGLSCSIKKLGASNHGERVVVVEFPPGTAATGVPVKKGCSKASTAVILFEGSN